MAQAQGHIGQFLAVEAWQQHLIIGISVMVSAVVEHRLIAGVSLLPGLETLTLEVILIVLHQLAVAAAGNAQQLEFASHQRDAIHTALHDVLLGAAGCLHHLIDGAVAPGFEKPLAEHLGQLVEHVAAVVEAQFLVIGGIAQAAGCAVLVAIDYRSRVITIVFHREARYWS